MTLTDSFWRNEKSRLLAILLPRLTQMAVEAAKQAAQKAGIGFNPALANANAARWARDYTDALLDQLGTTSAKGVGEIIAKFVETPGATYGDLQKSLMDFGAVRAQMIAVTETTRAYAEGELEAYRQEGITEIIWRTNRDEITCIYCGDINDKTVKIGEAFGYFRGKPVTSPPFHPNCRCWIVGKPNPANRERGAVVKPVNPQPMPSLQQLQPVPQGLGADTLPKPVLKATRYNEMISMEKEQLSNLIEGMKQPNPIPEFDYHYNKHATLLNAANKEEYQSILDKHVGKNDLRYFAGIKEKTGDRFFYAVDTKNGIISEYSEQQRLHYTVYYSRNINRFLEETTNWLVEIDPKDAKAIFEWTP